MDSLVKNKAQITAHVGMIWDKDYKSIKWFNFYIDATDVLHTLNMNV